MYHAIFCTDNPGGLAPRLGNRPDRPTYWSDFSDKPVSAGPTPDADPRAKAGVFEGVVVRPWGKTLPAD